jgi:CheY-like chemotaxis protein
VKPGAILVVDDNQDAVDSLCLILEVNGWSTLRAYDGSEAIALSSRNEVTAVVMDIQMPRVDGLEALQAIKARRPELPIIMVTAYARRDTFEQAKRQGATDILPKPVNLPALLALLENPKPPQPC